MLKKNTKNLVDSLNKEKEFTKYDLFILIAITILATFFRFYNLRTNPKWYSDEFVYLNAAWNLMHGSFQIGNYSTSIIPHPPLYSIINGFLLLVKYDIITLRIWIAFCGVLTTILLFFLGKELANKKVGLLSAFFFAIYPLAIACNRRAWPNNQAMLLIVITFYSCLKYKNTVEKKWLYSSIISLCLASLTSYWIIGLVMFTIGFFFFIDKKQLKIIVPFLFSFFAAFFIWALLKFRQDLIFDIKSTFARTMVGSNNENFFIFIIKNYINFFKIDYFIALGCIGIFLLPKKQEKISLISLFALLSFEIFRQRQNIPKVFYPAIILVPLISMGLAILFDYIYTLLKKINRKYLPNLILTTMLVPFVIVIINNFRQTINGFETPIDLLAAEDSQNTEKTAAFINTNINSSDLVIASFDVMWLLKCRTTDILFSVVQQGYINDILPFEVDQRRFMFDGYYKKAKYFICDNITRRWDTLQNGVIDIMHNMEMEGWKKVFVKGEYKVFANPLFSKEKENGLSVIIELPQIYFNFATEFFKEKKYDNSILELQKAATISDGRNTHFNLGLAYLAKNMKDKARKEFETVLKINPSDKDAINELQLLTGIRHISK